MKLTDILYIAVLWLWALARMPQLLDVTELPNKALSGRGKRPPRRLAFSLSGACEGIMVVMLKRAYESPAKTDGKRILVDRLWPRGLTKVKAKSDLWLKDVAPSTELRQWFGHDPEKWLEFKKRYRAELKDNPALSELQALSRQGNITLIYAARDQLHNEAVVLKQILDRST